MFQGALYLPQAHLYIMGARAYRPDMGRFLTPDPIDLEGGTNLYAFVNNAPLSASDPLASVHCEPRRRNMPPGVRRRAPSRVRIKTPQQLANAPRLAPAQIKNASGAAPGGATRSSDRTARSIDLLLGVDKARGERFSNAPFASEKRNETMIKSMAAGVIVSGVAIAGVAGGVEIGAAGAARLGQAVVGWVLRRGAARGGTAAVAAASGVMHKHHIFHWQFIDEFEAAGINIHLYVVRISAQYHQQLHAEWNYMWEQFLGEQGGVVTAEQAAEFAAMMMERWGLTGLPVVVY